MAVAGAFAPDLTPTRQSGVVAATPDESSPLSDREGSSGVAAASSPAENVLAPVEAAKKVAVQAAPTDLQDRFRRLQD